MTLNGIVQSAADILPHLDEIGGPMTYCHYMIKNATRHLSAFWN